ncbi:AMP-binding protein, partial [Bacillus cereus group sp. BfR-BA-01355]
MGETKNPEKINQPNDLLYLIYTSGTTGKPKGVMIENKGVITMKEYLTELYQITEKDHILQFANYIFDA